MKLGIGIKKENTKAVATILNKLLADEHVLYIKLRNAHWNIEGADFHAQHAFFEEIYTELSATIDDIAERVRSIGQYAVGSMKEFLDLTDLKETKPAKNDSQSYIKDILADFESVISYIRAQIDVVGDELNDAGTEDFLVSTMAAHEKTAWMLRSHLA